MRSGDYFEHSLNSAEMLALPIRLQHLPITALIRERERVVRMAGFFYNLTYFSSITFHHPTRSVGSVFFATADSAWLPKQLKNGSRRPQASEEDHRGKRRREETASKRSAMSPRLDMSSGESVTRVHVNPLPLAKNAMHSFSSKDTINRLLVSRPPPASSSTSRVPPIFQPGKIYAHAQVNKRYVTVLELTDSHPGVQLPRTVFATMDLYYPTRRFDAIFASNDWKNCEDFAKWNTVDSGC